MHDAVRLLSLTACLFSSAALSAQHENPDLRPALTRAIREWCAEYEAGRLGPQGPLRSEAGLQPRYAVTARAAGLLGDHEANGLTHLDVLQKLLITAEHVFDDGLADAVLGLAAIGFDKSLIDRDAVMLELGCAVA